MAYHIAPIIKQGRNKNKGEIKMIKIDDLKNGLDLGDYGDLLNNYRDSSSYICDAITYAADSNTSIYYGDIIKFISENVEAVNDAISEFGWDGCGGDLYKAGQMGEYLNIERDIYDHLSDALHLAALDFIKYDLKIDEIPDDLAELIQEWSDDAETDDRMDEIPDKIRDYFEEAAESV